MTNEEAIKVLNEPTFMWHLWRVEQEEAIAVATKALEQQKVGRWLFNGWRNGNAALWRCSVCNSIIFSEDEQNKTTFHKYCGLCGARMDGDEDDTDN